MALVIDPNSISFSQILADLEAFRDSRPDADKWNVFFSSGTGRTVTEMLASLGAFLTYQTITARRENFLQYAENRSSAIALSQSLGYSVFRGRNAHLLITLVPASTMTLPRFSIVGAVKDQDLVVLQDTPLTAGVQTTIEVVVGTLSAEALTVPGNGQAVFRFESPLVTEDMRLLLNGTEVQYSNRILDLDNDLFVAISNTLDSVDVSYLNRASASVQYTTGDQLEIQFLARKDFKFAQSDLNVYGTSISSYSVSSAYQAAETNETTRINAPLFHETQALVRARKDFLKVFKIIDPDFVSTNQRDVTSAIVELAYLNGDHAALTAAEKSALLDQLRPRIAMGIPPPLIDDPILCPLLLDYVVTLKNNQENTLALIEEIVQGYEDILGGSVKLEDLEEATEALDSVKIARVSVGSEQWAAATSYQRGFHVRPLVANGFVYELLKIRYFSGATAPAWVTTLSSLVEDRDIVWRTEFVNPNDLPVTWQPSTVYDRGAVVVPIVPNGRQYRAVDNINRSFGNTEVQLISFDQVPDSGTWRLHYDDGMHAPQRTVNLAYNASALDIQNALNDTECLSEVVVTGNYTMGFTVTFAGADANKQQPLLSVSDLGTDEVQLVSFDQVPNSGSFGLNFNGQITAPIAFNANAAAVKAALEALTNIDLVDVSGDFTNGFSVTFRGVNAKQDVAQLVQALLASPGQDEVQQISFGSVPTSGTWRLHRGLEYTSDLAYNASATAVQTALNSLEGLSSVVVSGDYSSGFTVTFTGADGLQPQSSLSVSNAGQNEKQIIQFSLVPDFGTWRLDYNGTKTSYMAFNATASDIAAALNALAGLSGVSVIGDYASGFTVEFAGADGLKPQPLMVCSTAGVNEVQSLVLSGTPDRGTYTLSYGSETTEPLRYDSTASQIAEALQALPSIDFVLVSGTPSSGYTIEFLGSLAKTDVPLLVAGNNTMFDDTVAEISQITAVANTGNVLDGKTFWLYDDAGSVGFWFDCDNNGTPTPAAALLADRAVRIGTVLTGDSAADVATKVKAAVNADSKFSATVASTVVTATSLVKGARTDADPRDSGFTMSVLTQGVSVAVNPILAVVTGGVPADDQLVRTDSPVSVTVSRAQVGLVPANSLLDGVSAVSVSVSETTPGQFPVSNLERSSVPVDVVITTLAEGEVPANFVESSGSPVDIEITTVVDAASAEPAWPTVVGSRVFDGDIIWQAALLNGTPDQWAPDTNYKVGQFVQPTAEVLDEDDSPLMYQCVGFVGASGASEPDFPATLGATVNDNNIVWKARDPSVDPASLAFNEYYDIVQTVTLKGP